MMTASGWSVLLVLADGKQAWRGEIEEPARTYGHVPGNTLRDLREAGLVKHVRRREWEQGRFEITDAGRAALRGLLEQVVKLAAYLSWSSIRRETDPASDQSLHKLP